MSQSYVLVCQCECFLQLYIFKQMVGKIFYLF